VIAQKGSPTRRRRPAPPGHVLGDGGLGNIDPEFQQLAMNAWCTPKRVVAADCTDQIADVGQDRRPTDTTTRIPAPVQVEAAPMPAHQRFRLEDDRSHDAERSPAAGNDELYRLSLSLRRLAGGMIDIGYGDPRSQRPRALVSDARKPNPRATLRWCELKCSWGPVLHSTTHHRQAVHFAHPPTNDLSRANLPL
jgi:hypothetical protein